jgi:hypothetical protein
MYRLNQVRMERISNYRYILFIWYHEVLRFKVTAWSEVLNIAHNRILYPTGSSPSSVGSGLGFGFLITKLIFK